MALYKYHYIELDTKRSPRISLQNIVAGETGNRLILTVTNNGETVDMSEKSSGAFIYRVCLKIDSDLGTRRQDSAFEDSGITFIEANTGDHGKINILLSKDSFTVGMNRCRIEIFSTRAEEDDTLIISAEWTFRAAGNPTGENAWSVYPSLIALETELEQLKTDTTDAKDAATAAATSANNAASSANSAASAANSAASAANDAATDATNAANAAWIRVDACNIALANVLEATTAANNAATSANNASTSATNAATSANSAASSANSAASAASAAAAAATAAAKKNFYNVKHDTTTWINGKYQTYTDDLAAELAAIAADSVFSSQVELPSGKVVTVYETHRHNDMVYFKSDTIDNVYVTAEMLLSASGQSQLPFTLHTDESPLVLHVSTITFDEANPIEFADEYDILSVDFAESKQTLFDAIGVRPIEVILPFGDKYYRLHTIGTFIDEGQQRTEKTVELTAAGDLLRTVPGALSNAYMSLTVTPHAPGYLLNASGYVVITES